MDHTLREQSLLNFFKQYKNLSKIDEIKMVYGLRLFILDLKKFTIIYSLAFILGITIELLLVQIGFITFRQVAFGLHCSGYWSCLIASGVVFLGGTYFFSMIHLTASFIYYLFFFCVFVLTLLAPISSKNIKIKGPNHRHQLRRKMYIRFFAMLLAIILLPLQFSEFLIFGVLIETLIICYSYVTLKRGKLECLKNL